MKNTILILMLAFAVSANGASFLIKDGKLQSNLDANGFKVTGSAVATAINDLTTKSYVDTAISTAIGGAGTVTSVGISVPSWLTAGSAVTTSGTIPITATSGQTANRFLATPDGTTGPVGLRAITAGDIAGLSGVLSGGTANKIPIWTSSTALGSSVLIDTGSSRIEMTDLTGANERYSTYQFLFPDGLPSRPSISFIGDPTLGIYFPAAGTLAFTRNADMLWLTTTLAKFYTPLGWHTDNAYDIGESAARRPRTGYFGTSVVTPTITIATSATAGKVWTATDSSGNGSWQDIKSVTDGGNHTIKMRSYIVLTFPHTADGVGAIISTNDNSLKYFGQAAFSGSAATNANFIEYRLTVPEDIDTSADLKVERWKIRLGAADTSAQSYNIGMASVADSASYDSPTIGQWVAINIAADASGASGDVETVSNVTLTDWKSNVTAGRFWVIRVNRDGTDSSTQTSYSGPLVISYGSTQ